MKYKNCIHHKSYFWMVQLGVREPQLPTNGVVRLLPQTIKYKNVKDRYSTRSLPLVYVVTRYACPFHANCRTIHKKCDMPGCSELVTSEEKSCFEHMCHVCWENTGTMMCGRCRDVRYCSKQCQTEDWDSHKHLCDYTVATRVRAFAGRCDSSHILRMVFDILWLDRELHARPKSTYGIGAHGGL